MVTCYAVHAASELSRSPARRFCSWVFVSLSQGCKILEGNTPAALASVASKIVASVDVLVAWLPKQKLKALVQSRDDQGLCALQHLVSIYCPAYAPPCKS